MLQWTAVGFVVKGFVLVAKEEEEEVCCTVDGIDDEQRSPGELGVSWMRRMPRDMRNNSCGVGY